MRTVIKHSSRRMMVLVDNPLENLLGVEADAYLYPKRMTVRIRNEILRTAERGFISSAYGTAGAIWDLITRELDVPSNVVSARIVRLHVQANHLKAVENELAALYAMHGHEFVNNAKEYRWESCKRHVPNVYNWHYGGTQAATITHACTQLLEGKLRWDKEYTDKVLAMMEMDRFKLTLQHTHEDFNEKGGTDHGE